jgi:hypothetical protein
MWTTLIEEKALRKYSHRTYAIHGMVAGVLLMIVTWVFPIPVAILVYLLDIRLAFVNVMFIAIPFILAIPFVGAIIGSLIPRSSSEINAVARRKEDSTGMSIRGTFLEK